MRRKHLPMKTPDPWAEIRELHKRMEKTKDPDPKDIDRLRQLVAETPGVLFSAISATQTVRDQLIEKTSHGIAQAYMLAEVDKLKDELNYATVPPLERLLIDHILTVRLRLVLVENSYNRAVVYQNASCDMNAYWDSLLTSAHIRFLRAIETLARVRRLARNTPLQINIAGAGGKQVNAIVDANVKKSTTRVHL